MRRTTTGAPSGCIVWMIVFGLLSICFLPVAMMVGGFTYVSSFAMKTIAPFLCPEGTTAEPYSYATTTTDEFGNSQPSTAYELHCVDSNGAVVKEDPVLYAFLWIGVVALTGLILAALLALALAAPAGILITRWFKRQHRTGVNLL